MTRRCGWPGFCMERATCRSMCDKHYQWYRTRGRLDELPRTLLRGVDLVEDFEYMQETEGLTIAQAAERMGIKRTRLARAVYRVRERRRRTPAGRLRKPDDLV